MTSLFPSVFEAVVFWGILVLWVLAFLIWAVRHSKKGKEEARLLALERARNRSRDAIAYARIGVLPNWLFYPGETLFVVGNSFALWSMSLLGRYESAFVQVLPDHKVIENGPYRHIRHPGYLGQIVAFIGLGLALQSWVALLVILIVAAVCLPTDSASKNNCWSPSWETVTSTT